MYQIFYICGSTCIRFFYLDFNYCQLTFHIILSHVIKFIPLSTANFVWKWCYSNHSFGFYYRECQILFSTLIPAIITVLLVIQSYHFSEPIESPTILNLLPQWTLYMILSLKSSITVAGRFSITFLDIPPIIHKFVFTPLFFYFQVGHLYSPIPHLFDFQWEIKTKFWKS